jgi:hypothetical protein
MEDFLGNYHVNHALGFTPRLSRAASCMLQRRSHHPP